MEQATTFLLAVSGLITALAALVKAVTSLLNFCEGRNEKRAPTRRKR